MSPFRTPQALVVAWSASSARCETTIVVPVMVSDARSSAQSSNRPPAPPPCRADHPMRAALAAEAHARPFLSLQAPQRVSHLAMISGEGGFAGDFAQLTELCRRYRVAPPDPCKHFSAAFGPFLLKWERHGEFCTYTFFRGGAFAHPFEETALALVPADWIERLPGERLVAAHLALVPKGAPEPGPEALAEFLSPDGLVGSRLSGQAAVAWTDFRLHGDGFSRILIRDMGLDGHQAGRLVQRLLEIETYRMMALLALPLAQELAPEIARIERDLADAAGRLSGIEELEDTRGMSARLSRLSAEIEAITARASFRFDATRAYYDLVQRHCLRLREERIEGLQTFEEFLERRLGPAMRTCQATARRIDNLARRLARASNLLSTRVNVALEGQNRDLLVSMDRRAQLQTRLQRTLEVISVCALTYYLSVLLGTALTALNRLGLSVDVELATGASIPALLAVVWFGLRWARRALTRNAG
jgi:Uncharacterized membrane-anchored protein conserved in bacteria